MKKIYILVSCLFFLFIAQALATQSRAGLGKYREAIQFVKEGQHDIALMNFRSIARDFPESKFAQPSLFAIGEYFYNQNVYYEAAKSFAAYIKTYPESDGAIFARAYLLRIMQGINQPKEEEKKALEDIEMEFFSQPLFLLFSEYKEVSYKSAFQNDFTIRHYIDAVEVYKNGTLFLKLTQ